MRDALKAIFIETTLASLHLRPALLIDRLTLLPDAIRQMRGERGCIFVGNAERVDGILTERDVIARIARSDIPLSTTMVGSVMTPNPKGVKKSASIARAVQLMATGGYRHLLVDNGLGAARTMFSTQEAVDYLYKRIAQDIVTDPAAAAMEKTVETGVQKFFQDGITRLQPLQPITVNETTSLDAVLSIFIQKKVGSVVVTGTRGEVRGIFTERDYLQKAALGEVPLTSAVAAIATKSPETILRSGTVALAFSLMSKGGFRHLPVVDDMEKIVGMISTRALLTKLADAIVSELQKDQRR